MESLYGLFTVQIASLELYRWLFFLSVWLPWLVVVLWFFFRMKQRFNRVDRP